MVEATEGAYQKTLVSYIDTLGFSDMVEKSRLDVTEVAKLRNRLVAMKRVAKENTEHRRASGEKIEVHFNSFSFSDLVVRCTAIGNEPPWFILLLAELHYLASRQAALVAEGVLMRGGVTVGEMFVDGEESLVFGPALVRSYELERKQAIYPRIVIDRDVAVEAMKVFRNAFDDLIRRGEDGTFFLDYLYGILAVQGDSPTPPGWRENLVKAHHRTIEVAIHDGAKRRDEHLKQKYRWVALYHNDAVRRLERRLGSDQFEAKTELIVPENALDF
jgi:hypothetical protein